MSYFISCITKKYACFQGRARRSEYWYYSLFAGLLGSMVYLIVFLLTLGVEDNYNSPETIVKVANFTSLVVGAPLNVIFFLPSLGVLIRRLHDIGKSGWYALLWVPNIMGTVLNFLPLGMTGLSAIVQITSWICGIILLVFCVIDSQRDENQYGPNPKVTTID